MTAQRRTLLLTTAATALLLPACLAFPVQPTPITPPEARDKIAAQVAAELQRKDQFHELPSRPGEVVAVKPPASAATRTEVTKRPTENPPPAPSAPDAINVVGNPPGPFPHGTGTGAPIPPSLTDSPLLAAVRAYAENRPDKAIEILKTLDAPNQEFVLAVVPILARGATANLASDPAGVATLVEQLKSAAAQLEPRAALRVENVTFCGKVAGFGRYNPWPQGQPYHPNDQAQLYLEVRNLRSQAATGPHGETHLTHALAAVEIRDAHGRLVEQPDPEDWRRRVPVVKFEKKLFSRGPLHDFHILYPFAVPGAPGVYTVTVEVRDPSGRRVARAAPVEFRVAGP